MAEFFKSAARAGSEVRRLGQIGPEGEKDQALKALSEVAQAGMESAPAPIPRRQGVARPAQTDSIEELLQAYRAATPPEQAEPVAESEGTFLGDVGRSVVRGGLSLGGGLYELGNIATGGALDTGTQAVFGTSGTEGITSARQSLNQADSAELQRQRAELEQADGFLESFGTVLTNPRLAGSMLVEMVPQLVTVVGAARMAATRVMTNEIAKGATKEAAEIAGQKAATRTALGLNAGLEGGMAAQDVRSDIMRMSEAELSESPQYQALIEQGSSPADARARLANDAAMVSAATAASISAISSRIFGTMEGSLAARGLAGDVAPKTAGEAVRRFGVGALKESGQETFEEGGSQFGQNVGTFAAVDRNQDLFEGVPQAAGAGGALGLLAGGATNIRLPQGAEPAAPAAPPATSPAGTPQAPASPPIGLAPEEFQGMLQSPEIVPYMSALYNQATENEQAQLQELARRNNIQVDLAESSQNASIVSRGVRLVEQAPSVAQAFMSSANAALLEQDTTALPPKQPEFTEDQVAQDIARNTVNREEQIEANIADIEASARELGIAPTIQPGAQAEDQAISTPSATQDLGVLMRGYQRRAQNISSMPPGARSAAATSSISEMVGAGFSPEQANEVFGSLTGQQAPAAEITEPPAAVPAEIAAQTTEATEPIAGTNIGDAGGAPNVPSQSTPPLAVSQAPAPLQTAPSNVQAPVTPSITPAAPIVADITPDVTTPAPQGFVVPTTISSPDGVFVVKNAPTGKKRADDTPVHAFVSRSGRVVSFDEKAVRDQFPRKVWTEPKVEGVIALPEDAFATADEWVEFVFRHEESHIKNPRMEGETTADYENRMNQIALTQMKGQEYADSIYRVEPETAPAETTPVEATVEAVAEESVPEVSTIVPETGTTATEEAAPTTSVPGDSTKAEYIRLFSGLAQATAEMDYKERIARLKQLAQDMQDLGFTREEAAAVLQGTREEFIYKDGQNTLQTRKVAFGLDIEEEAPRGLPSTVRPARDNPNVMEGTTQAEQRAPARDVVEQEEMRKETKRRRAERRKQKGPAIKPAPRRAPARQGELGETPDVRRYQARAERIMTKLVSRSSVEEQIQSLEKKLAELEKNRTYGRSSVEYIFGQFAQAGALAQEDMDDLSNQERNRELVTFLMERINQLQKKDLANRAEAIRLNIQAVDDALTDLRIEMEDAGISQNIIDDVLLDKEMGVEAIISGRENAASPEIDVLREQLTEAGVSQEQIEQLITQAQQPIEDTDFEPEINQELFGDASQAAAQVVDAIQNEVNTPRALMALRAEAEASEVGNLDIYDEMRRRGIEPDPELVAFASRPGVKYSLGFWLKKNDGRNPYTVREEWFGSLDLTLRQMGDKVSDKKNLLNELSQEERDLYNKWKGERDAMRSRLEKGDQQNESGGYMFDSLDNAFPHALFNKYPLNAMFEPARLPEGDRPGMLALADGNADALPTLWYEDLRHVMSVRPDLEPQIRETISEEEFSRYEEYRSRKTRELMRDSQMLANSPAFSQLMQIKTFLSDEQYQQYYSQIQQANANQHGAILQAAFEIAEAQRLAQEKNQDVDDATDAIMDAVYQQDEVNSASPDQMADATRTIDSDEPADPFPENVEEQADPEGDPSSFVDRMRFRRGRYSGVISAAEMFAHLNKIASGWRSAPRFQVLNNPMQLPDDLRALAMQKLGRSSAKGLIAPDGTVYIFSDFNESLEDAEFTFFHEVYGHFGLRQFLGNKLDQFLNTQYKVNKKVKAAADALMAEASEAGRGMTQLEATEEAIADLAVTNEDPSLILKIITALQKFLRSIKMRSVADWMESKSGGELAYVLSQSRRAVRDGRVGPLDGAPFDVRFNANKQPVEIFGTKNDTTTAYARYNPVLHQWTVFWDKDGLKAQNFGITTVDDYEQALAIVRQYGRAMSAKDFPGRNLKDPSSFKLQIPFPSDVKAWRRLTRKAQIKLQNKLLPVYEVARWINANGGNTNLENVLKLHRGKIKPHMDEFNRKYLRPIATMLRDIEAKGGSIENVDLYLAARHAKERNARVQDIDPNKKDGSGISNSDAARILTDFEKSDYANELRGIGMLLDGMSQAKIGYMLQHGLISEQQAQALSTYEHYVSLSGNASDRADADGNRILIRNTTGRSLNLRGSDTRRATGRSTAAIDVLENTLNSYLGVIIRGQKNVVNQSVLQMVDDHPDPSFAVVNRIKTTRKLDVERLISDKLALKFIGDAPTAESGKAFLQALKGQIESGQVSENDAEGIVRRRFEEAYERNDITNAQLTIFVKKLETASLRMGILNEDGYITTVDDPMYANDPNVLVVKDKGSMVTIEFMEKQNDPDRFGTFIGALSGMHNFSESETLGAFGAFNRLIGQLITSRNLTWVPVNWIRDIGTAYFNAAADPRVGPVLAKKIAREAPRAYKVAYKNLLVDDYADKNSPVYRFLKKIVRKPVSPEDQKLFEEFKEDGGETYFLDRKDIAEQIQAFQRELDPATGIRGTWEAYGKFADLLGQPAELSARFAAYKVLIQAGRSREEAAVYAKEITVNFEQAGSSAWIRSLILFFNPAVQGTARMFRDYSQRSGAGKLIPSKQFGSIIAGLAGLGMLTGFFARAMGDGEDDEINDLDQIPSGKRATSVVLFPGMPMGAPIPLPYGWNVFYAMGHFAADSIFGDTPASQTASRIASSAVNSFWPAGARDSGSFVKDTALSFVPTALAPAADIWLNENRFGAPIAKERNPFTQAEEANAYMNFKSASPISVYLMRGLNDLTGGSQYRSGMLDINPAYVDYVLSSYLPGLPTDAGRTVNLAVNAAIGREVKNPPLPLVDRFGSKVSEGWNAGAFRRAQTYVETKYKDAITSQGEDKEKILKEHPNIGGAKDALSRIDQQIRDMRTNLRAIEQNPGVPFKEKVAARNKVEELEKAYYKQGVSLAVKAGFKTQVIADN